MWTLMKTLYFLTNTWGPSDVEAWAVDLYNDNISCP